MKVDTFYKHFSKELSSRLVVADKLDNVLFQAWLEDGEWKYYGSYPDVKDLDVYSLLWGDRIWLTVK